MINKKRIQ